MEVEQLTLSCQEREENKTPFTGHLLLLVSIFLRQWLPTHVQKTEGQRRDY